jgi:exopolyphosphatase/guanosine-5'-triphosphate,3'-diphosphate pyrophosphatase
MTSKQSIAAIDMGSNGIRIALGEVDSDGHVVETAYHREAIRLGHDAFTSGTLQDATIRSTVQAFERFADKMQAAKVDRVRAIATSAMREVSNGQELVEAIEWGTGIRLQIIDPLEEARLMLQAVGNRFELGDKTAVLIDMGGGSIEVTAVVNRRAMGFETLPLGPVRLLERLRRKNLREQDVTRLMEPYRQTIRNLMVAELEAAPPQLAVGAGGNIKRLGRLRKTMLNRTYDDRLKPHNLDELIERLAAMSVSDRVEQLGLREDRADLILIAAIVLRSILDEARIDKLMVPGIGLLDGLLGEMGQGGGWTFGRLP